MMSPDSVSPGSPLSWGFFARGVPQMLRRRLFGPRPAESTFVPHVRIGQMVALFACFGLAGVTVQGARNGSGVAITLLGLAGVGVLALAIHSIWEARNYPVVPHAFAIGPFLASVILGVDLGLAGGRGTEATTMMRIAYAAIGLLAGYVLGGLVGFYAQRLGWIAGFFSFFSFIASAGLILLAYLLFV